MPTDSGSDTARSSLAERVLSGDLRALARLATYVENDDAIGRAAITALYPHTGKAHIIGVTGPPGAGKSTLVNALIGEYRARGQRVGIVAVDPSSPLTGGATLGDRIRMQDRHADAGVFIRSMASRGRPGGLAPASAGVVHLLDAAGFEIVLVETVGVGQDEVEIARRAHTTLLIQVPGLGDSIQTIKAGILEVGDVLVVNKCDRPGGDELVRDLLHMLSLAPRAESAWRVPVVRASATTGDGVPRLVEHLDAHYSYLVTSGTLRDREEQIASAEVSSLIRAEIERRLATSHTQDVEYAAIVDGVAGRRLSPHEGARQLLDRLVASRA
jgi:LAO/AO transport system kinase